MFPQARYVYLVYVDESYDADHYWWSALLVPERGVASLTTTMRSYVTDVFDEVAPHISTNQRELHGFDIFHGERTMEALHGAVRRRIGIYENGLRLVAAANPKAILIGRKNPGRVAQKAMRLSLAPELLAAIEDTCRADDERALLVLDREETSTEEIRQQLGFHHVQGCGGTLSHLLEPLIFVESHLYPGVQGADLIGYLHARRFGGRDRGNNLALNANRRLWDLVTDFTTFRVAP